MSGLAPQPNYFGRRLLRQLVGLREMNRMTQDEVGQRVHIEFKKLSRIERRQLPSYHELVALLEVYGIQKHEHGPYIDLWTKAKEKPWWRGLGIEDTRYICMEDAADAKTEFQLGHIPALLQTEQYARHTLTDQNGTTAEKLVEVRTRQQQRLTTNPALNLHAMIHEPVLHQGVDGVQLDKLIQMNELPNVTIRIVPQNHMHLGLRGGIVLLSFNDPDEPDTAFTETLIGLQETQAGEQVRGVLGDIDRLAKSPDDSLRQLHTLRKTHC